MTHTEPTYGVLLEAHGASFLDLLILAYMEMSVNRAKITFGQIYSSMQAVID